MVLNLVLLLWMSFHSHCYYMSWQLTLQLIIETCSPIPTLFYLDYTLEILSVRFVRISCEEDIGLPALELVETLVHTFLFYVPSFFSWNLFSALYYILCTDSEHWKSCIVCWFQKLNIVFKSKSNQKPTAIQNIGSAGNIFRWNRIVWQSV